MTRPCLSHRTAAPSTIPFPRSGGCWRPCAGRSSGHESGQISARNVRNERATTPHLSPSRASLKVEIPALLRSRSRTTLDGAKDVRSTSAIATVTELEPMQLQDSEPDAWKALPLEPTLLRLDPPPCSAEEDDEISQGVAVDVPPPV